jgi:molecular chaperone Hsp33
MTKDSLQRFIFENEPVRGEYVKLDDSLQTILGQHDYPPAVRRLLGEGLCAAALLSAIIKFKGRLTVQFRGKGKLRLLLAQCNDQYQLRGLIKCDGDLSYEELMAAFQDGVLMIMLDSGIKGQRYQGVVQWQGNSLAESIQGYFRDSEQLATKIWLNGSDQSAVGYLLQVIPLTEEDARGIESEIIMPSWQRILRLTAAADMTQLLNMEYPDLLTHIYPEETIRIFDASPVTFHCGCTRKRGEDAILLLGKEEAEEELKDKQSIVVTCDFCNKEYIFDRVDVGEIFKNHGQPPSDIQLH